MATRARRSAPTPAPLFATRHRGLREQLRRLARAADSANTVLLLGAAGTGKDRLARLLHERSRRAAEPFVRVDLAAVADDLFESELFGHERGAFTGAVAPKPGLLEGAGAGTLYLDRIDALSLRAQGKLLRLVEERLVRRVGGTRQTALRARLVASAGPDLPRRARSGEFREDLFYRLAVVTVTLPPLADRREDLLPAARTVAREAGGPAAFTPAARARLSAARLARELPGARERRPPRGGRGGVRHGPPRSTPRTSSSRARPTRVRCSRPPPARAGRSASSPTRTSEMVVEDAGGNVAEAARRLGIARKTLYERRG